MNRVRPGQNCLTVVSPLYLSRPQMMLGNTEAHEASADPDAGALPPPGRVGMVSPTAPLGELSSIILAQL